MMTASPPQAQINSVIALYSSGRIEKALETVEALIKEYPNDPLLYNINGICYKTISKLDEAVKSFEKALAIKSDYAEVHYNLGVTLQELGQLDAAVKSYENALAIKPDYANACNNLGNVLKDLGQLDASIKSFEKAIAIKPDFAEAHNNLGVTFQKLGQQDTAAKYYEKALAIKPDYADAHNNLGNALMELGRLDASVKSCQKALSIKPDFADAHYNLGLALQGLGKLDAAIKCYQQALAIKPDIDYILGTLVYAKMNLCIWDDLPTRINELTKKINNNEKVIAPFYLLGLIDDPELQRKTAEIQINEKYPINHDLPEIGLYPKHKKIRIGYFSADFREHPVSDLNEPLALAD